MKDISPIMGHLNSNHCRPDAINPPPNHANLSNTNINILL